MTAPSSASVPAPRLADRLAATRQRQFVGRQTEIAVFRAALLADESPFVVLHIVGPGGVGKSTLLREFGRLAQEANRPVIALDGRNLEPSPNGLLGVLGNADDWPDAGIWLFDTYETLEPIDRWLRETVLPQLPARSLVVFAGRNRPAPAWRTDLDWGPLTRIIELSNLYPAESQSYLTARGIPTSLQADALSVTRGHPLALALVADVLARGESLTSGDASFDLMSEPDVVRTLLERLVSQTPSADHRHALEIASLVWATTETLLAAVVDRDKAHDLFAWLRDLSFIEQGPYGLFPHDLARDVLEADLRWRDPGGYQSRVASLFRHFFASLQHSPGLEQQRIWFNLFSLLRQHPFFAPYFEWSAFGSAFAELATPAHFDAIVSMVRTHEGDASAEIASYWLRRQPDAFWVFRNVAETEIFGFMTELLIHDATPEDLATDPAVAAALAFAAQHGPIRPGESVMHLRYWMHVDGYQDVTPAVNLAAINSSIHWTSDPNLAWNFVATADPAFQAPHFNGIHIWRAPAADFTVGDKTYGVFAHDWRVEPATTWMELKYDAAPDSQPPAPAATLSHLVTLSRPDFDAAVRQALRDFTRPDLLLANPLTQTRLLSPSDSPASSLQALLRDAVATLSNNPKDRKLHRALWHTYLEPAPTQEQAAELLDLPFNTYRYHLAKGIERVSALLWDAAER